MAEDEKPLLSPGPHVRRVVAATMPTPKKREPSHSELLELFKATSSPSSKTNMDRDARRQRAKQPVTYYISDDTDDDDAIKSSSASTFGSPASESSSHSSAIVVARKMDSDDELNRPTLRMKRGTSGLISFFLSHT